MHDTPITAAPRNGGDDAALEVFPHEGWPSFSTNIDIAALSTAFVGTTVAFWRDGLGPWRGWKVSFPEGDAYLLSPPMPGWGTTVWHADTLPAQAVTAAIAKRFGDKALFITPDGVPVPRFAA